MPFWLQQTRVRDASLKYEPLREGSEDVQEKESLSVSSSFETFRPKSSNSHVCISKRVIILTSSIISVILVILAAVLSSRAIRKPWPVPEFGHVTKVFGQMDEWEYGPRSADLWHSVLGNKGFVLIEDWERYGLKDGLATQVPGAGIYGISATHQFHCIHMIRDAFMGLASQDPEFIKDYWVSPDFTETLAFKPRHIFHCLDYLRQVTMCNADTTLESRSDVDPYHIDGYGSPHQCKNWDEVTQWLGARMPPDERFHHQQQ